MIGVAIEWLLLWALWIVFAGSAGVHELAVGAVGAAIGTAVSRAARATKLAIFRPGPAWLLALPRLPLLVASDAALLMVGLVRWAIGKPMDGRLFELPLDVRGLDPASASYRALVTTFTSLPPNTYVIDMDIEHGKVLVHRLVPTHRRPQLVLPEVRQ